MNDEFPVVRIRRSDLKMGKDLMPTFRKLAEKGGLRYDRPYKIGIKTWFDKESIVLKNFIIDELPK